MKNQVFQERLTRFAAASVAMAHPDKKAIVERLLQKRQTPLELEQELYGKSRFRGEYQSIVSGHLKALRQVGLVKVGEKVGRCHIYVVNDKALGLLNGFAVRWMNFCDHNAKSVTSRHTGHGIAYNDVPPFASASMAATKLERNAAVLRQLQKPYTVVELWQLLRLKGEIGETVAQSCISSILRRLRDAYLVTCRVSGKCVLYQVNQDTLDLLDQFDAEYENVLGNFDTALAVDAVEYDWMPIKYEGSIFEGMAGLPTTIGVPIKNRTPL